MKKFLMLSALFFVASSSLAKEVELEAATSGYSDKDYKQNTVQTRGQHKYSFNPSWQQTFKLIGSRSWIQDDLATDEAQRTTQVNSLSGAYILNYVQNSLSLNLSQTKTDDSKATSAGFTLGHWFLEDTLQITLSYTKTDIDRELFIKYDSNADALFLPTYVEGKTYSLGIIELASPTTMILANYSYTKATDRPSAHSATAEWREALPTLDSSVQTQVGYFKNVGSVRRTTEFGRIAAYTARAAWNWTLPTEEKKFILTGGERYYTEQEDPENFTRAHNLTSTLSYFSFRYRPGVGPWTDVRNEIYLFGGRYLTSEPREGNMLGVGGQLTF